MKRFLAALIAVFLRANVRPNAEIVANVRRKSVYRRHLLDGRRPRFEAESLSSDAKRRTVEKRSAFNLARQRRCDFCARMPKNTESTRIVSPRWTRRPAGISRVCLGLRTNTASSTSAKTSTNRRKSKSWSTFTARRICRSFTL